MKIINKNVEMLHCSISNNKNKKAFTLVELIIVITILAILATIAFVGFQNFTKDARDGNRITTLKNIESGLTLYNIKSSNYPDPDELVEILGTGNILLIKQGIVGNDIAQKIKLNKEAKDPKDKKNYIYSITGNGKKYQLGTYLEENKLISYIPQITKTYENVDYSKRYFYTIGDKVGILIEQNTNQPIIKTQYLTGINLETNTNSFKVYFSNDTQSGSLISSGNTLITTIMETQKTTQTIKTTPTTWACGEKVLGPNGEEYNTIRGPDGKCWTSTNMKHAPVRGNSWCYDDTPSNCTSDGRLYSWYAAMGLDEGSTSTTEANDSVCKVLLNGWALPTDDQWTDLTNAGATGWKKNKLSGIVSSLPGGYNPDDGSFVNRDSYGNWWSGSEDSSEDSGGRYLLSGDNGVDTSSTNKSKGYSVVCIKN